MNVKTLNTTSLDGDVVIIKKGSASGGGSGGDTPSGGSNVRYFKSSADFAGGNTMITEIGMMGGQTIKWKDTDDTIRFECGNSYARNIDMANLSTDQRYIGALAMALLDAPVNLCNYGTWMELNLVEYISEVIENGSLTEITEEEFYTLE